MNSNDAVVLMLRFSTLLTYSWVLRQPFTDSACMCLRMGRDGLSDFLPLKQHRMGLTCHRPVWVTGFDPNVRFVFVSFGEDDYH